MTGGQFVQGHIALVAWREAHTSGINGMIAVSLVIRNRVNAGWHGGDWMKNIYAPGAFSSMNGSITDVPDIRDPEVVKFLEVVDRIYDGTMPDKLTGGAMYFCDPTIVNPDGWFYKNIIQNEGQHPRTASVGRNVFFK